MDCASPCALLIALAVLFIAPGVRADDMQWIWTPAQAQEKNAPAGTCYFRKSFTMGQPESGEVQITADDAYELFVNGRPAGQGNDWHKLAVHDIKRYLSPGRNVVAIKATNSQRGSAGVAARIVVKDTGGTHVAFNSDKTWRTSMQEFPQWNKHQFNDSAWLAAHVLGPLGNTAPWLDEVRAVGGAPAGRFETQQEFRVETVVPPSETGSLLAMTFNELGEIIASREGTGILVIHDTNHDGTPDKAAVYADQVVNAQGLLCLNGDVYAVGGGPDGLALYRLTDEDGNGRADKIATLLKFTGEATEHGPHAVTLGPDGMLYVMLGNHTQLANPPQAAGPYRQWYEGDLIEPKYEDPRGHAAGIKAPGGVVVRCDSNGENVEFVAGGLRNAYDMAFNRAGELFTYDSDMEWDVGLPWYRPTRVLHVVPGAEFGWRSGWSSWPEYFFDSLPALLNTGRGSPTGVAVYSHIAFPRRYHDALFVGDWARGRILAVRLTPDQGSYRAEAETFVLGKPLNVTDLDVGPDGGLYFCTGGRGTEGGVFRVVWRGKTPAELENMGKGIEQAIRQPQLNSAFARQTCSEIKEQRDDWEKQLTAIADSTKSTSYERCRALDLMQLLGPFPSSELLVSLGADRDPQVRAKAAYLMGIHADDATRERLVQMLRDGDSTVQRVACEALARAAQQAPVSELTPLLYNQHRHVAYAATRVLEATPRDEYRTTTLNTKSTRLFVQGALAMLRAQPDRDTCLAILERATAIMDGYVSDPDFIDLLRVMEIALERGELESNDVPQLGEKIAREFPTANPLMNRELVRLIVHLQGVSACGPLLTQLGGNIAAEEKLHIALYSRFLQGWTTQQKLELLKFYESARSLPGGASFVGYIDNVSRDFFAGLNEQERSVVLTDGAKWPSSALAVLAKLPDELSPALIQRIIALDRQIERLEGEPARRLGIGVVAVLGRSRDPAAAAYLREVYEKFPERRGHVAVAMTQQPNTDNWPILIESLPVLEGAFAQEVLDALTRVPQRPDKPEAYRQVILRGLKLGDENGQHAVALLEHWMGEKLADAGDSPTVHLAAWQKWFTTNYPHEPDPQLPVESAENKWTYDELLTYLTGPEAAHGNPQHGAQAFAKAQCASCHRYGQRGESIGPDLTTVSQRFQKKEILEAILFPSQVISDQYASKTVLTNDGRTITGFVARQGDGSLAVLQTNGQKVTVPQSQIDTLQPNKKSAMPDGLLNSLTLEEIANLFAYMGQPPTAAPNPVARRAAGAARK